MGSKSYTNGKMAGWGFVYLHCNPTKQMVLLSSCLIDGATGIVKQR